jgi:hypothetical protein
MSTSNEERFHARAIINIIKEHDRIDVCNDDGGRHGRRGEEEDGDDDDHYNWEVVNAESPTAAIRWRR